MIECNFTLMISYGEQDLLLTKTLRLIDLPSSMPMIATGARLAVATSLLVSLKSEMLLSIKGIGTYLHRGQETFKIVAGFIGIAFISLVGIIISNLVLRLEKRWLFWQYRKVSE